MARRAILTEKEKDFVHLYVRCKDLKLAAKDAGYPPASGRRIIRKPLVKEYYQKIMNDACAAAGIDAMYVVKAIKETIERCRQSEPVTTGDGEQVYTEGPEGEMAALFKFDARAILEGTKQLAAIMGMVKKEEENKNNVTVIISE